MVATGLAPARRNVLTLLRGEIGTERYVVGHTAGPT